MKKLFKNIFLLFVAISMFVVANIFVASGADAAPKKKKIKASLTQEQLDTMNKDLNFLTRKVYANSLFSPADNEKMINIKLDLDVAMIQVAAPEYAPMYYMEASHSLPSLFLLQTVYGTYHLIKILSLPL